MLRSCKDRRLVLKIFLPPIERMYSAGATVGLLSHHSYVNRHQYVPEIIHNGLIGNRHIVSKLHDCLCTIYFITSSSILSKAGWTTSRLSVTWDFETLPSYLEALVDDSGIVWRFRRISVNASGTPGPRRATVAAAWLSFLSVRMLTPGKT
jgi:hypothetical protein